jgi:hypothetical protein
MADAKMVAISIGRARICRLFLVWRDATAIRTSPARNNSSDRYDPFGKTLFSATLSQQESVRVSGKAKLVRQIATYASPRSGDNLGR